MRRYARSGFGLVVLLVGLSLVFPTQAHGDGWVSFNIGSVFGGSTGSEFVEAVDVSIVKKKEAAQRLYEADRKAEAIQASI